MTFCVCLWQIVIHSLGIQLRKMEHVYCNSKIYSHSSSWFLNAFVLVQGKGILKVTAYELGPSECHMNSGLLKGDLRLFLDVFACSRAKIWPINVQVSFQCLVSLLVYWKFFIFSTFPLFCEVWVGWGEFRWLVEDSYARWQLSSWWNYAWRIAESRFFLIGLLLLVIEYQNCLECWVIEHLRKTLER